MADSHNEMIRRWLERMPQASRAYHEDPTFHAQVSWLRRMLSLLDMALEDEGIGEETRLRVARTVIYGGPDESQALARIEEMQATARRAAWGSMRAANVASPGR